MGATSQQPPKIGLALGGGGARGLAHIGVLRVLEREGIPIQCIAGTSMGGLIGALYLAGLSVDDIETEAMRLSRLKELVKLVDPHLPTRGLLKGRRIYNYMSVRLGGLSFSDLRLPLAMVAVDLVSGREVVLNQGSVASAVRATISVPGVFAPVELGTLRLVDGGVLNNVPADVARRLGAQVVIAVDVLPSFSANQPGGRVVVPPLRPRAVPGLASETWHIEMIMIAALTEFRLKEANPEVLLRPDLPNDMGLFVGFDRPKEAIAAGEAAVQLALPQIKALL
jgi:NTE family protein